jgi:TolA-binding protein
MKYIVCIVVGLLAGCSASPEPSSPPGKTQATAPNRSDGLVNRLSSGDVGNSQQDVVTFSSQQIDEVKHKFNLLRDNMTVQEALSVLGLSPYSGRLSELSASSGMTGNNVYTLDKGHRLMLSYELGRAHSSHIIEASLDDQIWSITNVIVNH